MKEDKRVEDGEGSDGEAGLALWKKIALVLSLVLGATGAFAMSSGGDEAASGGATAAGAGGQGTVLPTSFGPDGTPIPGGPAGEAAEETPLWAPLLAKGGLSFFLAFCIGFALRTFLKITALVIGAIGLAYFGLHSAGIVPGVDWAAVQGVWGDLTANLGDQFHSAREFVTGSLPSAGAAGVGLTTGFRR